MKKFINKNLLLGFLLGSLICSFINVIAFSVIAENVGYTSKDDNWTVNNVQDAIDDLYDIKLKYNQLLIDYNAIYEELRELKGLNKHNNEESTQSYVSFVDHLDESVSKFGSASLYLNNTDKSYSSSDNYQLNGDFTIDYWIFENSNNSSGNWRAHLTTANTYGLWLGLNNGSYTIRAYNVQNIITVTKPENNKWTHVAITRKNGVIYLYFNGIYKGKATWTHSFEKGILSLGKDYNNGFYSVGVYIDEVRILNGYAEWYGEDGFTPPSHPYNYN